MAIPIIDLFAGPGGLGEGFSSLVDTRGDNIFEIGLSIEKDPNAHMTLELRSFFRKFKKGSAPAEYYKVLQEADISERERLINDLYQKYPEQAKLAKHEAWCTTLGEVKEDEVDERIQEVLKGTREWVLIGGPPCQAYSLVGRSRRQWKENVDEKDPRVHLYKEYLRIIAAYHPTIFVMENVKGLLSSKLNGKKVFELMLSDLKNPSSAFPTIKAPKYRIYSLTTPADTFDLEGNPSYTSHLDYLIRSEQYGIPQRRHRVILLGIREDVNTIPPILRKRGVVNLSQVISDLPKLRSGINRSFLRSEMVGNKKKRHYQNEEDSDEKWKSFLDSFRQEVVSWNGFALDSAGRNWQTLSLDRGAEFIPFETPGEDNPLLDWFKDDRINGVCNHASRSHLKEDLKRYLFSSIFSQTYNRAPKLDDFEKHAVELMPDHANAQSGKFSDRFRVQMPDLPATTVTSHISKDGHYFIHYDPTQCRSLTVREAARVQTFPDNYLFCGSRTGQYHQVGNAVPPYLAYQIAKIVHKVFSQETKNK